MFAKVFETGDKIRKKIKCSYLLVAKKLCLEIKVDFGAKNKATKGTFC